uniref:Uncharacterized protein n=1 Tax=Ixodes ricinus TaxID=34613 RepID=A0A6B0U8T2_IXORI
MPVWKGIVHSYVQKMAHSYGSLRHHKCALFVAPSLVYWCHTSSLFMLKMGLSPLAVSCTLISTSSVYLLQKNSYKLPIIRGEAP